MKRSPERVIAFFMHKFFYFNVTIADIVVLSVLFVKANDQEQLMAFVPVVSIVMTLSFLFVSHAAQW